MINLELTIREALYVSDMCPGLYDKVVAALEKAAGVDSRSSVTITRGVNVDNRIACIKALRAGTGMDLKNAKEWMDVVMGYNSATGHLTPGRENTIDMGSTNRAEYLLRELTDLGCEGYLS